MNLPDCPLCGDPAKSVRNNGKYGIVSRWCGVGMSLAEVCHWDETYDGDFKEWYTDCDHILPDSVFNPEELEIEYCPKCGRKIEVRHV